ncbi:MAG TPA: hypothetical protein VGR00_09565, partial [Thermoanaerobaculia bacterium]|nr:hypothetical protein [Thermoanaerobaculia bacterium]
RYSRIDAFDTALRVFFWSLARPRLIFLFLSHLAAFTARNARTLWRGRREIRKLSIIIHNFMDAQALDPERVAACSFMVATDSGFVSMCAHNAERESFIRRPLELGAKVWDPLTGQVVDAVDREVAPSVVLPSVLSNLPVAASTAVSPASPTLPAYVGGK